MSSAIPHILIVDDEPVNLAILSEYMLDKDYKISTAVDGLIAWEMLESDPEGYDVILLDRMMPRMDGMEVLSNIKAHPVLKNCPVILQTALNDQEEVLEGMRAGAYYYLTKPFEENQLFSIVDAAVQERMHFRNLQVLLEENSLALGAMTSATFKFQTLEQAQSLSSLLAKACPKPERVIMGLSELMVNAVEHGNLGITYDEKTLLNGEGVSWEREVERRLGMEENKDKYAEVSFSIIESKNEIEITIRDQGEGFDWEPYLEMRTERIADNHGRGIAMAGMLSFSRIEYRGKGNEVHAFLECSKDEV